MGETAAVNTLSVSLNVRDMVQDLKNINARNLS